MSKEFIGFNKNDLESLGFKKDRDLPLGDEYHIEYSPKVESKLKELGFEKTWGHEGMLTMYSTFKCDNKEHPDYGKSFISVRENTTAENSLNLKKLPKIYISKSSGQGAIIEEYKENNKLEVKVIETGNKFTIDNNDFENRYYEASKIETMDYEEFYLKNSASEETTSLDEAKNLVENHQKEIKPDVVTLKN